MAKKREKPPQIMNVSSSRALTVTPQPPKGVFDDLTEREANFIREYLIDYNATKAAMRMGYAGQVARNLGWRMITKKEVAHAILRVKDRLARAFLLDKQDIINEFWRIYQQCLQAEPVEEFDYAEKRMVFTGEFKFDSKGANTALANIAKMCGYMDEDRKSGGKDAGNGLKAGIVLNFFGPTLVKPISQGQENG